MNGAYLHLVTNHIPVVGVPLALLLLIVGWARGSREVIRISYQAILLMAFIIIVVDRSGGPAAHVVRDYPGIVRADIHEHAEAADGAFIATEVLGGLALIGLWVTRGGGSSSPLLVLILVGGIFTSCWLSWVAHLGGLIRHPEIRPGSSPSVMTTTLPVDPSHPPKG